MIEGGLHVGIERRLGRRSAADIVDPDDGLRISGPYSFSEEAILEMLMLAGHYRAVACVVDGLRLPNEPIVGGPFAKSDPLGTRDLEFAVLKAPETRRY